MTASSTTWSRSDDPKRNKVQFNLSDEEYGYFLYAVQLSGVDLAEFCRLAISASVSLVLALPWPPGLRPSVPSPAPRAPSRSPKAEQDDHARSFESGADRSVRSIAPCSCGDPTHHGYAGKHAEGDGHLSRPVAAAPHPLSQVGMQGSDRHPSAAVPADGDESERCPISVQVTGPSPDLTGCG